MKKCSKSVVECLRDNKIEPYAEANSFYPNLIPSNAINYSSQSDRFHTSWPSISVWWMVDFKARVSIKSYQFDSGTGCDWIKYWKVSVSDDNITWIVADSPSQQFARNNIFKMKYPTTGRYLRVTSLKGDCGYVMVFNSIKIYGSISSKTIALKTYRMNQIIIQIMFLIFS